MLIRRLTLEDVEAYASLRREMLQDSPWAFASSPETDVGVNPELMRARMAEPGQAVIGAFDGERLIAAAGLLRNHRPKMAHRVSIWGVYCTPDARGRGLGKQVMNAAIDLARSWPGVNSIGLSVSARATAAHRLYQSLGFQTWGTEPQALMLDGAACDELHMVLFL